MIAGRLPRERGEIAVDAQLAERLSWVYANANESEESRSTGLVWIRRISIGPNRRSPNR